MEVARGMYDGEMDTGILWVNLKETGCLEELNVDGRITLKYILKNTMGGMDWSWLTEDLDRWQTVMNTVMKLQFSRNAWYFLGSWATACQEGFYSAELVIQYLKSEHQTNKVHYIPNLWRKICLSNIHVREQIFMELCMNIIITWSNHFTYLPSAVLAQ